MFALLKNNLIVQVPNNFKVGEVVGCDLEIDSEDSTKYLPVEELKGASEIVSISDEREVLEKELMKKKDEEFNKLNENEYWVKIF